MQRTLLFFPLSISFVLITGAAPLCAASKTTCKSTASCQTAASQITAATTTNDQLQLVVPFAVPVGVPVAPFAPYFYSYQQFQPQTAAYVNPVLIPATASPATYSTATSAPNASPAPSQPPSPIVTHCTSCHGGQSPKANLSLEHPESLSPSDRLAAIRAVITGLMPQGSPLSIEDQRAVISALAGQSNPSTVPPDHQPNE